MSPDFTEETRQPSKVVAAMSITVEQAMIQLQSEFASQRQQMQLMAQQHGALQNAHLVLRAESDALFRQRQEEIAASEKKLNSLLFNQKFDLLDAKALQPDKYKGRRAEAFKPWARKLKAYCNAKRGGFRKALEGAEKQQQEITDLTSCFGQMPNWQTPSSTTSSS